MAIDERAGIEAARVIEADPPRRPDPRPIRLRLGDVPLTLDGDALERIIYRNMPGELGGDAPRTTDSRLELVVIGMRAATVAALPVVKSMMKMWAPNYPAPNLPRRTDPLAYLIRYFVQFARTLAEARTWQLDVRETETGDIEISGVHPATPGDL